MRIEKVVIDKDGQEVLVSFEKPPGFHPESLTVMGMVFDEARKLGHDPAVMVTSGGELVTDDKGLGGESLDQHDPGQVHALYYLRQDVLESQRPMHQTVTAALLRRLGGCLMRRAGGTE